MSYTTRHGKLVRVKKDWQGQRFVPEDRYAEERRATERHYAEIRKGQYGGACNRSACLAPDASWYNHGSNAYYCASCAHMLNTDPVNRADAMRLFGHELCTPVGPAPEKGD